MTKESDNSYSHNSWWWFIVKLIIKTIILALGLNPEKLFKRKREIYYLRDDDHTIELLDDEKFIQQKRKTTIVPRRKETQQVKIKDNQIFKYYGEVDLPTSCKQNTGLTTYHPSHDPDVIGFSEHTLQEKENIVREIEIKYKDCPISLAPSPTNSKAIKPGPEFSFITNEKTELLSIKIEFKKNKCGGAYLELLHKPGDFYKQSKIQPIVTPESVQIELKEKNLQVPGKYRLSTWFHV